MLSGANERVQKKLKKAGIIDLVGLDNYFKEFSLALKACEGRIDPKTISEKPLTMVISEASHKS